MNYNAEKFLDECISSIYKTEKINFEIILVDNASTDKSYREYTQKFPEIKLIENKKNLGYCEGNNVGIRASKGEFIVVLNPDTVVTPTWLYELIHSYQENGEGIYQPKILANSTMMFGSMPDFIAALYKLLFISFFITTSFL